MKKLITLVMLSILTVMNVNAEETTLWEGDWWFSWEAANTDEAHKGWNANSNGVNFADYNEGDVFYFYLVKDSEHLFDKEYYNYRFDDSNWNALPGCAATDASGNETKAKFVLTADIKTALASADFALHGHGLKLVKVTKGEEEQPVVIEDLPAATLWTGEQEIDGWGVKCMVLNTENEAFTVFTEKLTKACNLYFLVENTTGADFRIAGAWGDWAVTAYPSDGYNHLQTLDADNVVKVALTEEFVKNAFIDKGGVAFWGNGGFKIKGIATTKETLLNKIHTDVNGYATYSSNNTLALNNLPAGLEAYTATLTSKTLSFAQKTDAVGPETGLLFKGDADTDYFIPATTDATAVFDNALKACVAGGALASTVSYYIFVMQKATTAGSLTFKKLSTTDVTMPANKAYVQVAASVFGAGAHELNVSFGDGETTGINAVKSDGFMMNGYYDLQGRKVAQPTKGLYIVNGKKVVIK